VAAHQSRCGCLALPRWLVAASDTAVAAAVASSYASVSELVDNSLSASGRLRARYRDCNTQNARAQPVQCSRAPVMRLNTTASFQLRCEHVSVSGSGWFDREQLMESLELSGEDDGAAAEEEEDS